MKIWILSDTHLGMRNGNKRWQHIANDCFNRFILPTLQQNVQGGDILVHCGDVFDNRQSINIGAINDAVSWFETFSKMFNVVYVLCGNHDTRDVNSNDISSLECLKHIDNVHIVKEQKRVRVGRSVLNLVPWQNDNEVLKEWLGRGGDYTFCHAEVRGAKMNYSGIVSENGIDNIDIKNIYSGHIHYRQQCGNVTFVGSPYAMTMSDIGNEKGIYCIDEVSGEVQFFSNDISPKFIRIKKDDFVGDVETLSKRYANHFVEIVCGADAMNDNAFVRLITSVGELGEVCDIKVSVEHNIYDDTSVSDGKEDGERLTLVDMMKRYVSLRLGKEKPQLVKEVTERCEKILDSLSDISDVDTKLEI